MTPRLVRSIAMDVVKAEVDAGRLKPGRITKVSGKFVRAVLVAGEIAAQELAADIARRAIRQHLMTRRTLEIPSDGLPAPKRRPQTK